jgi:DNA-binding XRE family transcriptional regulator
LTGFVSTRNSLRVSATVELRVIGPAKKRAAAFNALRKLEFEEIADSILWREAFPELEDPDVPGVCLRGARRKESITQDELARTTGIPQRHVSEIENGERPIGKKKAVLLAKALDVTYRIFL